MNDRGAAGSEPPRDALPIHGGAGPEPHRRPAGRPGRTTGVLVGLLIVVLAATAAVATIIAVHDNASARQWRDRAGATEARLDQTWEAYTDLSTRFDEVSETVDALEERTITLADEKARAQDRATLADVDGATAATVADRLETCTRELIGVFSAISAATSQEEIDALAADFQATAELCDSAADGARSLGDFLAPAAP